MRYAILSFGFLVLIGCAQERIPKPENLLTEQQMIDLHLDLSLLNASSNISSENHIPLDSLYKFHGIDSITFVKSNLYYASKPKSYVQIFEAVNLELEQLNEPDSLSQSKNPVKQE